jgi:mRNA-degrading endonuclease RelE of RelBE toxin-antitoxin system
MLIYKKSFKKKLKTLPKEIMFQIEHKIYKLKDFDLAQQILDIKPLK